MKKKWIIVILFAVLAALSVSCKKKEKKIIDLHLFVSELKAKSNDQQKSNPVSANPNIKKPTNYKTDNSRDPFGGQIYVSGEKLSTQRSYSEKELQNYSLTDLKLVGVLFATQTNWALIETPDKAVYSVTIGARVGSEGGILSDVSFDSVKIQNQQQVIILKLSKFIR